MLKFIGVHNEEENYFLRCWCIYLGILLVFLAIPEELLGNFGFATTLLIAPWIAMIFTAGIARVLTKFHHKGWWLTKSFWPKQLFWILTVVLSSIALE